MSVLINLPEDLIIEILQEWLQAEQIGFLDSACCNLSLRCQLLTQFTRLLVTTSVYTLRFYDWTYLRDIKLKCWRLFDDYFDESSPRFKVKYEHIQRICLLCTCVASASKFINSCLNLTSLDFVVCNTVEILENMSNLRQIEQLTFHCSDYYDNVLRIIVQQCTYLRTYAQHSGRLQDLNLDLIYKQLFANNPMLRVIETPAVLSLAMIRECCPNIEAVKVAIDIADIVNLPLLSAVVKRLDVTLDHENEQIIYDKEKHLLSLRNIVITTTDGEQALQGVNNLKTIELDNASARAIDHLASSLEKIKIHFDDDHVDTLQLLLTKCKKSHYVHIEVAYCNVISELVALFSKFKPVTVKDLYLDCASLSEKDCLTIMQSCKSLQQFVVRFSDQLSSEAIEAYEAELHNYDPSIEMSVGGYAENELKMKIIRETVTDIV